jgi:hypothetical protein
VGCVLNKSDSVTDFSPHISVFACQYYSTSVPSFLYLHVALTRSNDGQKASVLETSTVPNVRVSIVTGTQHMQEKLNFSLSVT